MKITIISASTRANSESRRVSDYLSSSLQEQGVEVFILDLHELRLPVFDASGLGDKELEWDRASEMLDNSDGYVFVSPEWDGMFSAGLHNMFHYVDEEMADKPVLPVGVSSGRGGRYPLAQMRMMGYKNTRFVFISESLFFDHVGDVLVEGVLVDERVRNRTEYALKVLLAYAEALVSVRESGVIDYETFAHGL